MLQVFVPVVGIGFLHSRKDPESGQSQDSLWGRGIALILLVDAVAYLVTVASLWLDPHAAGVSLEAFLLKSTA